MRPTSKAREVQNARARELKEYLGLLYWLRDDPQAKGHHRGAVKTANAAVYLLIYNMVEATMTEIVDEIMADLRKSKVPIEHLRQPLQEEIMDRTLAWIRQGITATNVLNSLINNSSISQSVVGINFRRDKFFSGNVDAKKVRWVANCYGIVLSPATAKLTKGGDALKTAKDKRNQIAHGSVAMSDACNTASLEELEADALYATRYLTAVVRGAEHARSTEAWKCASAPVGLVQPNVQPAAALHSQSSGLSS